MKKVFVNLTLLSSLFSAEMQNSPMISKNIGGSDGLVFPKGKTAIMTKWLTLSKDSSYNGDLKVTDLKNRKMEIKQNFVCIKSGIGYNSEIFLKIPYINKKLNQTIENRNFDMQNRGLGDISLLGRYSILNQRKGDFAFLSIGAGLKLPTGDTSKTFSTPFGKKSSNETQMLQLGSGSYDYILDLGFTKITKNSRIDANINYLFTNKGDNDYQFGDTLKWNLGYSFKVNAIFALQMELDGISQKKNSYKNRDIDSTGGNFIYLTPGFKIRPNKEFDLSFGYSKMIKRDNNYDSKKNIGGLSEDYKLLVRLAYMF